MLEQAGDIVRLTGGYCSLYFCNVIKNQVSTLYAGTCNHIRARTHTHHSHTHHTHSLSLALSLSLSLSHTHTHTHTHYALRRLCSVTSLVRREKKGGKKLQGYAEVCRMLQSVVCCSMLHPAVCFMLQYVVCCSMLYAAVCCVYVIGHL